MKDDEQFTQDALSHLARVEPSAELRRLVAEIPLRHPRETRSYWPFANLWMPSLAMAAVAVLGLFVGRGLSGPGDVVSATEDLRSAQVGTSKSGPEELGEATPGEANDSTGALESSTSENETELDELLVLATAGDFTVDDWDLSEAPDDPPEEGTF